MGEEKNLLNRATLLADVSVMYYVEGKDQSAISREIGVTRSMVSRMLTEARNRGIVEIKINRPLQLDHDLEEAIKRRFDIDSVFVATVRNNNQGKHLDILGKAAAEVLKKYIKSNSVLGIAWGTTISATVDAVEPIDNLDIKVVQLVGAMGAQIVEYDGHALVQRLTNKLNGESYFINAPYICQTQEIAQSMMETKGIRETIELGAKLDVALLGIGTTETEYSSYFLSGLLPEVEIKKLRKLGVVGDIASSFFMIDGKPYRDSFMNRLVAINESDLRRTPIRIGVAGGPGKAQAIIGALNTKIINVFVTDSITARSILGIIDKP